MTLTKKLTVAIALAVWIAAIAAAMFGVWLPLLGLLAVSAAVVLAFGWPVLWRRLRSREQA